jgi:hypothetical protein
MNKGQIKSQNKDIYSFLIESNHKGIYYIIGDKSQNIRLYKNRAQIAWFSGILDEKTVAAFVKLIMLSEINFQKDLGIAKQNNDVL